MDKYTYIAKLSRLISNSGNVDLDKLTKVVELNEEFYNKTPTK